MELGNLNSYQARLWLGEGGLQTTTGKTALEGVREEQSPPWAQVP